MFGYIKSLLFRCHASAGWHPVKPRPWRKSFLSLLPQVALDASLRWHDKKIIFLLLFLLLPFSALAAPVIQLENTKATLVSERTALEPGKPLAVALLLEPKAGWHTYWENPGDAGMPTTLAWTLPEGFAAGSIDWPAPAQLAEGPLVTYAYQGSVFLPVTIAIPAALDATAQYPIRVKAEWLVCKDICIPESADLDLTLPASGATDSTAAALFVQHRAQRPITVAAHGSLHIDGKQLQLTLPATALKSSDIQSAQFTIREQNVIDYAARQSWLLDHGILTLTLQRTGDAPGSNLSGILTVTSGNVATHYNITFDPATAAETLWFPVILLFALLGGLILNLMPCVLPILSLKALAIARKSGAAQQHVLRQGVAYTLGILASFAIIAGILIGLRAAGESVGWGYQMQSPAFVCFLIYLLFTVGLSLSGLFHLPVLLGGAGHGLNPHSARGSFLTGILAAAVATPCTAPFMAPAVGAALTMPAMQSLLVFETLGLGLALPFLLISLFPRLRRFLPQPGAWMERFKQFLAFPMYASVIWLLWVLTLQTGAGGMAVALIGLLAIAVALLLPRKAAITATLALILLATLAAVGIPPASEGIPYSKEKLEQLRAAGQPVYVDATAAWCITCQLNARMALRTDATMEAFKTHHVTLMIADWTRRDDAITEFLSEFGHKGVPLNVYYPPRAGPIVLPQILTPGSILKAIEAE